MGWSARQWLAMTPETTYGVYNTTGTQMWVRLTDNNAFTVRPKPLVATIRSADGGNRRRQRVSSREAVSGTLNTLFYPSQAPAMLSWGVNLNNYTPQSYTIDHFDSVRVRRYLGCLVKTMTIGCAAAKNDGIATLSFEILGQQPASPDPTLAEPLPSAFPTESPYTHQQSAGLVSIGGTRTKYRSIELKVKNLLIPTWDETTFPSAIYWGGRDVDWTVAVQYVSTIDRANFESQTPLPCSIGWSQQTPAHSASFNFAATNFIGSLTDDLPLDGAGYETLLMQTFYDNTAATDLILTAT